MTANSVPSKFPRRTLLVLSLVAGLLATESFAQDPKSSSTAPPSDSITRQHYKIAGVETAFTVTAGTLPLNDEKGERQASIFYTAYVRDGAPRDKRAVSFVFNGGPGASSAYLHIGALGPRVVDFGNDGTIPAPPGRLIDNPDTWLDLTDLVFIDPIGSSYSRPAVAGEEAYRRYWGVREDLASIAKFIELYLVRNNRQLSPKYIVGESYGGFRAARLPLLLATEHGIGVAGVFMFSPLLEFRLAVADPYDPLPDALRLPSYAAVKAEQNGGASPADLAKFEKFALGDYLSAMNGSAADEKKLSQVYQSIADYTGLPKTVIEQRGGRIPMSVFIKELRRDERKLVSLYDGTLATPDPYPFSSPSDRDPMFEGLRTLLTNTMADYLGDKLGVRTELPYRLNNASAARLWNWWDGLHGWGGYQGSANQLLEALATNRGLKVVIAHGVTDLVTPYFATKYVIEHLPPGVIGDRVTLNLHPGGHMMYVRPATRAQLHADAAKLYAAPAK